MRLTTSLADEIGRNLEGEHHRSPPVPMPHKTTETLRKVTCDKPSCLYRGEVQCCYNGSHLTCTYYLLVERIKGDRV